jgi:hypothetical protein
MLLLILMCSEGLGNKLCAKMDKNLDDDSIARSDAWVELIVAILLIDDCLHWNLIERYELMNLKKYMPMFLTRFKAILNLKKETNENIKVASNDPCCLGL